MCQRGIEDADDFGAEFAGLAVSQIREDDDGQIVIYIAFNHTGKTRGSAAVPDHLVSIHAFNAPPKAIARGIGLAVIQRKYCPYPVKAGLFQHTRAIETFVPFGLSVEKPYR